MWAASAALAGSPHFTYNAQGDAAWANVLNSIGLRAAVRGSAAQVEKAVGHDGAYWMERARQGAVLVTDGGSALAVAAGIVQTEATIDVHSLSDPNDPKLEIIWQTAAHIPVYRLPEKATVYLREWRSNAPVMAGLRVGLGAILWTATPLSDSGQADSVGNGYARYSSIPQALLDLGLAPPLRSNRVWAFFDSSYRTRVDVDYFAERWSKAGIGALQIAAWHYWEPDPQRDEFLARLIEACHRRAIVVYAWLEFPHVSETFWDQHPQWREQTAAGQDAQLDWRKLMNLLDPDCERAVWQGTQSLMRRFDWDGVNLAELYFESLEGADNPSRFTPMNALVRKRYQQEHGIDPLPLVTKPGDPKLKAFLDWRAALARQMQETWLTKADTLRVEHPDLDVILTHVDDRFDTRMRDRIGADAATALGSLTRHDFTFLVEDPATIWNLGPQRYTEIAARYAPINPRPSALAVDINVVERYQDVYPTKQQVGTELAQLVHAAAQAFPRVALYFEKSIRPQDYALLPIAAAEGEAIPTSEGLGVHSRSGVGVQWTGEALVDGKPWPIANGTTLWLPPGDHTVTASPASVTPSIAPAHILNVTAEITHASTAPNGIDLAYRSQSRAYAIVDQEPTTITIDDTPLLIAPTPLGGNWLVRLPRGQHVLTLSFNKP